MSDRTDPMSAAARHINGGGPLAPLLALLTEEALGYLAVAAQATFDRRIDEWRATLCDHPPTPECFTCGAPKATLADDRVSPWHHAGVTHRPGCAEVVQEAEANRYHPRAALRLRASDVLAAERERLLGALGDA